MSDSSTNNLYPLITASLLENWGACKEGLAGFNKLFPAGADLPTAVAGLIPVEWEWAEWLFNRCKYGGLYPEYVGKGCLNTGNGNTGNWNTGNRNTGNRNTGNRNTGSWNIGNWNAGSWNTGDRNTGNWNTGNRNTGSWNAGNWNTGYFNTGTPDTILVFNAPCDINIWEQAEKPDFIYSALDPELGYRDAWKKAWENASKEDKELVKLLPNFNADIFEEITGIRV